MLASCSKSNGSKSKYGDYPITPVSIQNVVLTDSFWLPKIKTIQDSTIPYAFAKCDSEGRMENFLIAGHKKQGKTRGKMPFDDTDLYKIIEGASTSLISDPNPKLDHYLDSIIGIIAIGQEGDGYITTWFTIDSMNPPASWVKPSHSRWENEISSHELYNSGHLLEAATTHYLATGKTNFLNIAKKNADLLVKNFGPGKHTIPPGHQIVETGLVKMYRITKDTDYLHLAKYFLDLRGDSSTHKLYGSYNQDSIPVTKQFEAVGHAVRAVYMYAGMTDIAAIYKDSAYRNAVDSLFDNVTMKKMYITGGIGARHEGESFGKNYELPNQTAYCETCAAIGDVYWDQRLFMMTGDVKYYDVIERTLYNGLISGISLNGKEFFYPNPLESDGKYQFNQGATTRSPWFDCSCCPTNLIRFVPSIPDLIYAQRADTVYVNLYIGNKADIELGKDKVNISQTTEYPWNGLVKFDVNPQKEKTFTLKLRIPGWARNQVLPGNLYSYVNQYDSNISLSINGKNEDFKVENGYIVLNRKWKKDDKVELDIPMQVREVVANSKVADDVDKVAFEYGPMVFCGEQIDNPDLEKVKISGNDSLNVGKMAILKNKVNVLKGMVNGKELTLVPYYIWSNRGTGEMKVWFPKK